MTYNIRSCSIEMKNIFCWSIYTFLLSIVSAFTTISMLSDPERVTCKEGSTEPLFKFCKDNSLFYSIQNFVTLQIAASVIVTFGDSKRTITPREISQHRQ